MSNKALQKLLIEKIRQTDDNVLLEEATRLLDREIHDAIIYILSELERSDIEEARQQIKNGGSHTHSEAN